MAMAAQLGEAEANMDTASPDPNTEKGRKELATAEVMRIYWDRRNNQQHISDTQQPSTRALVTQIMTEVQPRMLQPTDVARAEISLLQLWCCPFCVTLKGSG